MTSAQTSMNADDWQQQANRYLLQGNYTQAANLYEQAIEVEPELKSHYWHLGLMLLLQGQEAEAHMTWMLGMAEGEPEQVEQWTTELVHILQAEAERQEALKDYQLAWAIRQHIKEIAPTNINNLLYCIALSIQLGTFSGEYLTDLGIIELLQAEELTFDFNLLRLALEMILDSAPEHSAVCTFTEACLCYAPKPKVIIDIVVDACLHIAHSRRDATLAARFIELCLHQEPNNTELLYHLAVFYQDSHQYLKGIDTAKHYYEVAESLVTKIVANHILIRALISASGYWEEYKERLLQQESLLVSLAEENPTNLDSGSNNCLVNSSFFFPYLRDEPHINRLIQNQISRLYQNNFEIYAKDVIEKCRYSSLHKPTKVTTKKVLNIGYISHFLRIHSVGWLARWIFQHHDRENFQIYAYLINYSATDDFTRRWFINNTYRTYRFEMLGEEVVERIREDEVDILIDLDSLTFPSMCEVLSVKPAPIQATWLGWDASGLPSIDYYIADPYVLPDSAQDYYTEKIVRLPNTYVAVDGFEVGVPNLRRDRLNIPSDAVIYLVTQNAYKRHLDNVRLQMRIIKEVPNSYLLIKGLGDRESSRTFFEQVAEEVGVSCDRLRFLPRTPSEEVHRANLNIADVVLDTYPYNGATTTLETLWMGVPLVTRVGQQFSARNSYAFMMNVGVTEGIAWTDEEYVEWGVRLGKDPALRQQINWKLQQSRQTSPLWNAKQFTREMEKAYQQMWQRYVEAAKE
ncbi:O-linked N-acetylglucosamine transferase, SPINDLY family protein [Aliterella atlantica]|uniref:protein O-GlcNAc transferase n=1 Tax=Aliterella atlantica CENA595 TaxID=1618023 RepID=A0A0D8ZSM8_9CYAN|nr:tetratricopeptide repeat protein [Aliterella atlantica]KJH71514.1 O-linked N-acetylglucosamine transferase, SPINDLY family protein [Aliterella atlantica CENA595]